MADYSEEISQLEQIVNGSATSITIDGVTTRWDLDHALRRLNDLRLRDDASIAAGMVRPTITSISIGGAW